MKTIFGQEGKHTQMEQQQQHNTSKYDDYSLICGILGFFFFPSAIGGVIFGYLHKKYTEEKCAGLIVSWISLLMPIILILLWVFFFFFIISGFMFV